MPQCQGRTRSDDWGHASYCSNQATCVEDGKSYCRIHAPSKVAERKAKRDAAFQARMDAAWTEGANLAARNAEDRRRLALFDDLVAACVTAEAYLNNFPTSRTAAGLAMRLHNLIAKANLDLPSSENHAAR